MPVLTSPDIANKLKENWLMVYPEDSGPGSAPLDDSLTSLHWLQNFSIVSADPERPGPAPGPGAGCPSSQHPDLRRFWFPRGGSESPSSPPAGDTAATGMPPLSPATSGSGSAPPPPFAGRAHPSYAPQVPVQTGPSPEVDYRTDPSVKPPFSYASLICMAMRDSDRDKVPLAHIYSWITRNFCYYRTAEPSWQNSIRHNLSLNKCFKKVPRQKDEPGKGGFWQLDPDYAHMFVNGIFKRRRMSSSGYNHRPGRPGPGYHGDQYRAVKRKPPTTKTGTETAGPTRSPLLATEARNPEVLRGDLDLASVFDDVLGGSCSTFEELDLNTALRSLGCDPEASLQGRGRWSGDPMGQNQQHQNPHQSYGYVDLMDCPVSLGELHLVHHPQLDQDQLDQDQVLQNQLDQNQQHLQQFEASSLFPERPEGVLQPWEEIKEEAVPLTLDQGFGLCDGFFSEMQPWERVEAYL